jgi:hypothetical protein
MITIGEAPQLLTDLGMQQIAPAVFSTVEVEPRLLQQHAQKIAVSLRRTAKREPFTRQLPSGVTVWAAALVSVAAVGRPPCPLNCHFIRQPSGRGFQYSSELQGGYIGGKNEGQT